MRFFFLLLFGLSRLTAADAARDARWRQDLDTLSLQLPALHPNLFFHTPRSVFDSAVSDLRNNSGVQMPAAALPGTATVRVQRNGSDLATGTAQIAVAAPGLFADMLNLARPGAVLDENSRPVSDASPARRGSVVQIYATGQGGTLPAVEDGAAGPAASQLTPRVYFGDERAEVLFSGLQPAFPGLWQINVRVPDVAVLSGQTPVFVVAGSSASNPVTVAVN